MAEIIRLNKVLRELNISLDRAVDFLETKNVEIEKRPTTKITSEVYDLLAGEFQTDASKKVASKEVGEAKLKEKEAIRIQREQEMELKLQKAEAAKTVLKAKQVLQGPKKVGKIDLESSKKAPQQQPEENKPVATPKQPAPESTPTPESTTDAKSEATTAPIEVPVEDKKRRRFQKQKRHQNHQPKSVQKLWNLGNKKLKLPIIKNFLGQNLLDKK